MVRVLVVDDEPLVAQALQAFLEDEGMAVTVVGDAEQATARVERGEVYDVCVMDLRLPGMNGGSAIRVLHELLPSLQYVIYTGSTAYTLPADLAALGVQDVQLFSKPLADMGPLADLVRALVGLSVR